MIYMFLEGIKGESNDGAHKEWIEIISASHSISRAEARQTTQAKAPKSAAALSDFFITKLVDMSSSKIAESILYGRSIGKVLLHFAASSENGTRHTYLEYELRNVVLSQYSFSAKDEPVEQFALNFEEIKQSYEIKAKDNKTNGKVSYNWRLETVK
jgi:type VI secretion system secreted protein Hcp